MSKIDEKVFKPTPEMLERAEKLAERAMKLYSPPKGFNLPSARLSYSQIEMYLRCPRQYKFRYIDKLLRPPGVALVLGSGTHKAVETTHHHIVDHGVPAPDEMVLDAFADSFDTAAEDVAATEWIENKSQGAVKDQGIKLLKIYNSKFAPKVRPQVKKVMQDVEGVQKEVEVRGIEKRFEIEVAGVPMLGYIDLIDTNDATVSYSEEEHLMLAKSGQVIPEAMRTVLSDFKTVSKTIPKSTIDSSLQLTLYSYAEKLPLARYDQLIKTQVPKVARVHTMRTEADYLWMKEIVYQVASAISAGVFPPCDPTAWVCGPKWCGFYDSCRGAIGRKGGAV